jgi:hypothetical protein
VKPLVTTVRAIRELATGMSPDAIGASPVLHEFERPEATYLIAADDDPSTQRVVLIRESNVKERYVPEHLARLRREVLSRMASFAERARQRPLTLPRGWSQYKHDNLVAFFVTPIGDAETNRWIAEVGPGERADVTFWRTTTSANKLDLAAFAQSPERAHSDIEPGWVEALASANAAFEAARRPSSVGIDVELVAPSPYQTRQRSLAEWLAEISDDQRAFIDATANRSIRLRGPAGSGKTLALTLKAVQEVIRAREAGEELRVLVVTHSWALAAQIADSMDGLGVGRLDEIEVLPLLEIAQLVLPSQSQGLDGFHLIGDDSYSGKRAQLDEILEVVSEFVASDWVTYRSKVSEALRTRVDSEDPDEQLAFAWDLLIEFGSVIGASAIFPGAGSQLKYMQLQRARWMLPLETERDLELVFHLYSKFMESLEERSLVTSDQVLADFLSYLETHAWNRARRTQGYDLVFVDEFHLFSPLERQVLHYLNRDVSTYPKTFMAIDPRQSPSEAFIGVAAEETRSQVPVVGDESAGDVTNFELTSVHRFTPQILELVKHVHLTFPVFDLGQDWDVDIARVESTRDEGPVPQLISASSRTGEETDIYSAIQDLYTKGRVALAVVDMKQWRRFSDLAASIGQSGKYNVSAISGRSDIEGLGYRRRGLVVGSAEYLAGLQFDTVLVAGIPDMRSGAVTPGDKTRFLSLLYLSLSRAEREVRVFTNDEDGGPPDVLAQAVAKGLMKPERGKHA